MPPGFTPQPPDPDLTPGHLARRLAERWRPLMADHAAALGRFPTLRRTADDALAALKRIEQEPAGPVEALAARAGVLRDRLEHQCRLISEAAEAAAEVVPVLRRVATVADTSSAVFLGVARGLLHELRPRPGVEAVLIDPRLIADGWSPWPADPIVAEAFLGGWQTARLTARALQPVSPLDEPDAIAAVAGALLQDVGLISLRRRRRPSGGEDHIPAARRYAAVSAALAGGLTDAPLELVRVIAGHHDRDDGTGPPSPRPTAAATKALPASSSVRLVAAANRLRELIESESTDSPADFVQRCGRALERLERECARGWWSDSARQRLADCVTSDALTTHHRREHAPHRELAGPHEPAPVRGVDTLDLAAAVPVSNQSTESQGTGRSEAA